MALQWPPVFRTYGCGARGGLNNRYTGVPYKGFYRKDTLLRGIGP